MNKATFTGNLGADAIIKDAAGKKVLEFNIGVAIGSKEQPQTLWVKCSRWSEKTAIVDYLKKGTKVLVYGDIGLQTYTNKEGKEVSSLVLRVDNIELLGSKAEGQPPTQEEPKKWNTPTPTAKAAIEVEDDSTLPF